MHKNPSFTNETKSYETFSYIEMTRTLIRKTKKLETSNGSSTNLIRNKKKEKLTFAKRILCVVKYARGGDSSRVFLDFLYKFFQRDTRDKSHKWIT